MSDPFEHIYTTENASQILSIMRGKKITPRQVQNDCNDGKLTARRLDPDNIKSPWMIYLPPDQYPPK